jgi:hypothetical protein
VVALRAQDRDALTVLHHEDGDGQWHDQLGDRPEGELRGLQHGGGDQPVVEDAS